MYEDMLAEMVSYLCLRAATVLAALAGVVYPIWTYETANVSIIVASHVRHRLHCHGINVRPSQRFPSPRTRPAGSLVAGISARFSARQMMLLSCWCLVGLPVLRLQERSCSPRGSGLARQPYYYYYYIIIIILFFARQHKACCLKIVKLDIMLANKISHSDEKNYVSGKVLLNATALPRWSDTESLW